MSLNVAVVTLDYLADPSHFGQCLQSTSIRDLQSCVVGDGDGRLSNAICRSLQIPVARRPAGDKALSWKPDSTLVRRDT
jgi:hypothetical protein